MRRDGRQVFRRQSHHRHGAVPSRFRNLLPKCFNQMADRFGCPVRHLLTGII
jgi:hypothetical protein